MCRVIHFRAIPFGCFLKSLGKCWIIFLLLIWFHWVPQFKNTSFVFISKYGAFFKIDGLRRILMFPIINTNIYQYCPGTYPISETSRSIYRLYDVKLDGYLTLYPIKWLGFCMKYLGPPTGPAKWRTNCCCLGGSSNDCHEIWCLELETKPANHLDFCDVSSDVCWRAVDPNKMRFTLW